MPSTNLPLPALRAVRFHLGSDLAGHVTLLQLKRETRAKPAFNYQDEDWRRLLARNGLRRGLHLSLDWRILACRIVAHNVRCRLCKTYCGRTLNSASRLKLRTLSHADLFLGLEHAAGEHKVDEAMAESVQPIHALSYDESRLSKFSSIDLTASIGVFDIYAHWIGRERIRLSLSAILVLEDRNPASVARGTFQSVGKRAQEGNQGMHKVEYRVCDHITLQCLFAFDIPLKTCTIDADIDNRLRLTHEQYLLSCCRQRVSNPHGLTAWNLFKECVKDFGSRRPGAAVQRLRFSGGEWYSEDRCMRDHHMHAFD